MARDRSLATGYRMGAQILGGESVLDGASEKGVDSWQGIRHTAWRRCNHPERDRPPGEAISKKSSMSSRVWRIGQFHARHPTTLRTAGKAIGSP